jgi:hypothetical protein
VLFYERVPDQVRANMVPDFDRAASETRPGMKQCIIESVSNRVSQVSQVMFDDAEQLISRGIRQLIDPLTRNYNEMTEAVDRQIAIVVDNTRISADSAGAFGVPQHLAALDEIETTLQSLADSERESQQSPITKTGSR